MPAATASMPANASFSPDAGPSSSRSVDDRGRLVERDLAEGDRRLATVIHLLPLAAIVTFPIGLAFPIGAWLIGRSRSAFVDDHGRVVMDAMISYTLWFLLLGLSVIGVVLIPVVAIVGLVAMIRGAADAGSGRYTRYPLSLSILS
jgi:uncharacterized Tic20 family protein